MPFIPLVFPAPPKPSRRPADVNAECVLCGAQGPCREWSGFSAVCGNCERRAPTLPFGEPIDPSPIPPASRQAFRFGKVSASAQRARDNPRPVVDPRPARPSA